MAMGRFPQPGDTDVNGVVILSLLSSHRYLIYIDAFASEWATPDAVQVQSFAYAGAATGNPLRFIGFSSAEFAPGTAVLFDVTLDGEQYRATNIRAK